MWKLSNVDLIFNICPFLRPDDLRALASTSTQVRNYVINCTITSLAMSFGVTAEDMRLTIPQTLGEVFRLQSRLSYPSDILKFSEVFLYACASGFTVFVEKVLRTNSRAYAKELLRRVSTNRQSCIMFATVNGHTEVIRCLLENGVSPDAVDQGGKTAVWNACRAGHTEIAECLIRAGAIVLSNPCPFLGLMSCPVKSHSITVAELIVTQLLGSLEVDMALFEPWNEFSHARPTSTVIRLLVALRACISARTHVRTLHAVLQLVRARGAPLTKFIRFFTDGQESLLITAVNADKPETIKPLVLSGLTAVCDKSATGEKTPLYVACENGNVECVEILLALGASVSDPTSSGRNSLHVAVERGHIAVVELLCMHATATDLVQLNSSYATPFLLAENKGRTRMVEAMLECYKRTATGETVNALLNSKLERYMKKPKRKQLGANFSIPRLVL